MNQEMIGQYQERMFAGSEETASNNCCTTGEKLLELAKPMAKNQYTKEIMIDFIEHKR